MLNPSVFFSKEEKKEIEQSIKEAEKNTSGEIRVHIESNCSENELDRAAYWFSELKMHKTELRNGVLIYMALSDKKFAIIGDIGINMKVSTDFWESTKEQMIGYFKEQNITKGICAGIIEAGNQLKRHFPYQKDDLNELNDEISFGK
ncbi:MAG: TPM domain-containing protein [Prolixibacteraceae bacterium]|nr:TPM domain-containing protein [Prolixibacteraceae bacterium]